MSRTSVNAFHVVTAWSGDGDGSYSASAIYDDLDVLLRDVRGALAAGRHVLLEPSTMTKAEFDAHGVEFPDSVNPLLATDDQ